MTEVVKNLEAKVEQLNSLESTTIEQQGKVTQMEAQLELNVSPILFNLIQSFSVGKNTFGFL
jgi:hypothetical protein